MSETKFTTEYRKAADSISVPEGFEENLLLNLRKFSEENEKSRKSRTPLYLSLVAAALAVMVGLSLIFGLRKPKTAPLVDVSLSIRSALSAEGVSGARVVFRDSEGNLVTDENGTPIETISDENGLITARLPEKGLTAEVSLEGYITLTTPISRESENIYISPVMTEDTYRAVLTWEKTCDLDAVLSITKGEKVETVYYFGSDIKNEKGEVIAALDTDDTTGEGLETITMNPEENTLIRYSVGSYSHLSKEYTESFGSVGAQVTLYRGNEIIEVYELSDDASGNAWTVFELENGTLTKIDTTKTVGAINEIE